MIHKERVEDLIKRRQDHKSSLGEYGGVKEENEDGEENGEWEEEEVGQIFGGIKWEILAS